MFVFGGNEFTPDFNSEIPDNVFAADTGRMMPETPQLQLLFECYRAARLLQRMQTRQRRGGPIGADANFGSDPNIDTDTDVTTDIGMPFLPIHAPFGPLSMPGRAPHIAAPMRPNFGPMRGQGRLINLLTQSDGMLIKDIVDAFDIRPSSASELVAKLEKQGLVHVESDETDKRARKVFLTEQGKAQANRMKAARDNVTTGMFEGLNEEEQSQLLALLKKMNTTLAEKSSSLDRRPGASDRSEN